MVERLPKEEIKITPEMIEAGAAEFASFDDRFEREEDCVIRIYEAMEAARLDEMP